MLEWMNKAACLGEDESLFFEDYLKSREVYDKVNGLCSSCPVKDICLKYGKSTKSVGVWGGFWLYYGVKTTTTLAEFEGDEV